MERNTEHDPLKGLIYALVGTVLLGCNFVTAKYALAGFNPQTFSAIWSTAAAFFALVIAIFTRDVRYLAVPRDTMPALMLFGFSSACAMLFGWSGLKLIDPSFSSFIWRFAPVIAIIAGALVFKEHLRVLELVAVALMLCGSLVSTLGRWEIVGWGFLLTLASAAFTGITAVVAKLSVARLRPNVLVFYRVACAVPFTIAWVLITGALDLNVPVRYWIVTCLGALLGPCLSFVFTFRAYRYWDLSRASMVQIIQPLIVMPLAYAFLARLPAMRELLGGMVILAGGLWIALIQLSRKPNPTGPRVIRDG